jgi:DNA-binding protein H-NS
MFVVHQTERRMSDRWGHGKKTMETPMTRTYSQVMKQIEALKVEAEKLRRIESNGVVARIREAIGFYGLTAADLGLSGALPKVAAPAGAMPAAAAADKPMKRKGKRKGPAKVKTPPVPKFRDEEGHTWGGIGKRPDWLRAALANGKTLQDFLIKT